MTPASLRAAFAVLESESGGPREVRALDVEGGATPWGPPRIAIDTAGHRHVLMPVPPEGHLRTDARSAGIQLGPYVLLDGAQSRRYLDLACRRPDLFDVFAVIAAEVLGAVSETRQTPDGAAIRVLDRWRALLARGSSEAPSIETLAGLWAELAHVREVCRIDPRGLVCWRGPDDAIHDLRVGNDALEVKATLVRTGWRVTIHGLDQLEVPSDGSLHFAVSRLEHVVGGGVSVPELADDIVSLGADATLLYERLASAGLQAEHMAATRQHGFRLLNERVWMVDAKFPRITRASFVGGTVPSGVARIDYQLDLAAYDGSVLGTAEIRALHTHLAEARS